MKQIKKYFVIGRAGEEENFKKFIEEGLTTPEVFDTEEEAKTFINLLGEEFEYNGVKFEVLEEEEEEQEFYSVLSIRDLLGLLERGINESRKIYGHPEQKSTIVLNFERIDKKYKNQLRLEREYKKGREW